MLKSFFHSPEENRSTFGNHYREPGGRFSAWVELFLLQLEQKVLLYPNRCSVGGVVVYSIIVTVVVESYTRDNMTTDPSTRLKTAKDSVC